MPTCPRPMSSRLVHCQPQIDASRRPVHRLLRTFFSAAALLCAPLAQAAPQVIFDNFKGTDFPSYNEIEYQFWYTYGTVINSTVKTTINGVQFRMRPNTDLDLIFMIWDSQLSGRYGSVDWTPRGNTPEFSMEKHFTAQSGPVDFYLSFEGFSFTLEPDHRYDFGVFSPDVENQHLTGSYDQQNGSDQINTVQNGLESINMQATVTNYFSEHGYGRVDPHIRLLQNASPVPEPGSLALVGLGLLAMPWTLRRAAGRRARPVRRVAHRPLGAECETAAWAGAAGTGWPVAVLMAPRALRPGSSAC